jgi:hypothetical protein
VWRISFLQAGDVPGNWKENMMYQSNGGLASEVRDHPRCRTLAKRSECWKPWAYYKPYEAYELGDQSPSLPKRETIFHFGVPLSILQQQLLERNIAKKCRS